MLQVISGGWRLPLWITIAVCLLMAGLFTWAQAQSETRTNLLLFSPVNGQLLDHGKPMAGQTIQRMYHWNMEKKPHFDSTHTDSQGHFHFDEVRGSAEYGFFAQLFNQTTIIQEVNWMKDQTSVNLYVGSRHNFRPSDETGYPTIEMVCDLTHIKGLEKKGFPQIECDIKSISEFDRQG